MNVYQKRRIMGWIYNHHKWIVTLWAKVAPIKLLKFQLMLGWVECKHCGEELEIQSVRYLKAEGYIEYWRRTLYCKKCDRHTYPIVTLFHARTKK